MKCPKYAKLLLNSNTIYPIVKVHFQSAQVTLQETPKVFNTVSIKDVEFDFSDFSDIDIRTFFNMFK